MKKTFRVFALLICLAVLIGGNVYASTNSETIYNESGIAIPIGEVYINVKYSSVYAETTASVSFTGPNDSISVSAAGSTASHTGSNYTSAYVYVSGSFTSCSASGSLRRGNYSGSATCSANAS